MKRLGNEARKLSRLNIKQADLATSYTREIVRITAEQATDATMAQPERLERIL